VVKAVQTFSGVAVRWRRAMSSSWCSRVTVGLRRR
jgi:hypothetical protein